MVDEVYKILQGRLRLKQAQLDNCGDQYDCDGCMHHSTKQSHGLDDSARRSKNRSTASNAGEDPLSHKIIEKRRRDRMNSCLADLSHLIPSNYLKKGRGRIEKTEIVEMAIKHIKHLQELLPPTSGSGAGSSGKGSNGSTGGEAGAESTTAEDGSSGSKSGSNWQCPQEAESFKNGFSECMAESIHFLVEKEHIPPENPLCSRLVNHLKKHLDQKPGLAAAGAAGSGSSGGGSGSTSANEVKPSTTSTEPDSDYGSFSDVGSIASTQSTASSSVLHTQRHYPSVRMMMQHHHLSSMSESGNSNKDQSTENKFVVKRRSSEEQGGPGGKFKFKDSIRERFSHEFEAKSENATATSDHFTGNVDVNTIAAKVASAGLGASSSHQEFYTKRRRPSRSCDESGSEVNSIASHQSQASVKSHQSHTSQKPKSEIQSGDVKDVKKSVPIFALHPKGSHYIPLSVTEEVIQPYLHLFDQGSELPLMLHPITISVNFCGPIRIAAGVRPATHLSHRTSQVAASGAEFLQQRQVEHLGREHQVREHQALEHQTREQARDHLARELQGHEKQSREHKSREHQAREHQVREHQALEHQTREQAREHLARELQAREHQSRENQAREHQSRENQARDKQGREHQVRSS